MYVLQKQACRRLDRLQLDVLQWETLDYKLQPLVTITDRLTGAINILILFGVQVEN